MEHPHHATRRARLVRAGRALPQFRVVDGDSLLGTPAAPPESHRPSGLSRGEPHLGHIRHASSSLHREVPSPRRSRSRRHRSPVGDVARRHPGRRRLRQCRSAPVPRHELPHQQPEQRLPASGLRHFAAHHPSRRQRRRHRTVRFPLHGRVQPGATPSGGRRIWRGRQQRQARERGRRAGGSDRPVSRRPGRSAARVEGAWVQPGGRGGFSRRDYPTETRADAGAGTERGGRGRAGTTPRIVRGGNGVLTDDDDDDQGG